MASANLFDANQAVFRQLSCGKSGRPIRSSFTGQRWDTSTAIP